MNCVDLATIFLLSVVEYALAGRNQQVIKDPNKPVVSIVKGGVPHWGTKGSLPGTFSLCSPDEDYQIKVDSFYSFTRRLKINLDFFIGDKKIESYTLPKFCANPDDKGDALKTKIVDAGICKSFKFERATINNKQAIKIRFYNSQKWWCDVYYVEGKNFIFKEMDDCDILEMEYKLMVDPDYNSVEPQMESYLGEGWKPCPEQHPSQALCERDKHTIQANYFCREGKLGYNIANYFDNREIGTFTISKSYDLVGEVNKDKICNMFVLEPDMLGEYVTLHFFKGATWHCQDYEMKKIQGRSQFVLKPRKSSVCERYRSYYPPNRKVKKPRGIDITIQVYTPGKSAEQ